MAQANISRLQSDLDTMKSAMGTGNVFPRQTMHAHFGFGFVGFITAVFYFLFPDLNTVVRACTFLLPMTAVVTWLHFTIGKLPKLPPVINREQKRSWKMWALVLPVQLIIIFWTLQLGVPKDVLVGVVYCLGGISLLAFTGFDKCRLSYTGIALVQIMFGLIHPFYSGITYMHFISMLICATFWTSATILYIQHRRQPFPDIKEM